MHNPTEPHLIGTKWLEGRWHWTFSNGQSIPVVRGGDGDGGTGEDPPPPPPPPKSDPPKSDPPKVTFTAEQQAELNRIAAREKDEGKRAAERAIADELGVPLDQAKKILEAHNKAEEEKKSEEQRLADERAALAKEREDVDAERHRTNVERALVLQGVTDEVKIRRIAAILATEGLQPGARPDDISASVTKLREDMPELFGAGSPPPPPDGGVRGNPPPPRGGEDAFKRGEERAKAVASRSSYAILEGKQ